MNSLLTIPSAALAANDNQHSTDAAMPARIRIGSTVQKKAQR